MSTKQKVIQARKAVREKLRLLKLGQLDREQTLRETFKPVTDSIKQLKTSSRPEQEEEEDLIADFINSHNSSRIDKIYGVSKVKPYTLGSKPIKLTENTIQIGDIEFQRTPGLLNLIFLKPGKDKKYTTADLKQYGEILQLTDLHKKTRSQSSLKYKEIIKPLLDGNETDGEGIDIHHKSVNEQTPEYIYYSHPDEVIDRLRLLIASTAAGNTAHSNEIVSIISQLRQRGIIE